MSVVYFTLEQLQKEFYESPHGIIIKQGSRLEMRYKQAKNPRMRELIRVIEKEIEANTAKVSKKVEDDIEFIPSLNKWKVRAGSFAHALIPHHPAWSNNMTAGGYLYVGKASGKFAHEQTVEKLRIRDRKWEQVVEYRRLKKDLLVDEKFMLDKFGPGSKRDVDTNIWNPKAETYIGPNNFLQSTLLDLEMSVSKVPSPDDILNAQADAVPAIVIETVKGILLKRFSKNNKTKIPFQEITEKSNVHSSEHYLGLKLAFERKGWEVAEEGGVFVFSMPKAAVK
jgi:hypothetical protein